MVKVTTQNQEDAHRREVIKGASIGGSIGVGLGLAGVLVASRRYPSFRQLTIPFRTFLVTSTGTFGAIVTAERRSLAFHQAHHPFTHYKDQASQDAAAVRAAETIPQRALNWGRDNRYGIVFGSWVASMGLALAIVGRSRYLSTAQKIVQARVYAQGLTLLVLIVTAAFEASDAKKGSGRWETVMVLDPNDPEHKHLIEKRIHKEEYEGQDLWKDMVAAEERRLAARKQ